MSAGGHRVPRRPISAFPASEDWNEAMLSSIPLEGESSRPDVLAPPGSDGGPYPAFRGPPVTRRSRAATASDVMVGTRSTSGPAFGENMERELSAEANIADRGPASWSYAGPFGKQPPATAEALEPAPFAHDSVANLPTSTQRTSMTQEESAAHWKSLRARLDSTRASMLGPKAARPVSDIGFASNNTLSSADTWPLSATLQFLDDYGFGQEWRSAFIEQNVCGEQFQSLVSYPTARRFAMAIPGGATQSVKLCNCVRKAVDIAAANSEFDFNSAPMRPPPPVPAKERGTATSRSGSNSSAALASAETEAPRWQVSAGRQHLSESGDSDSLSVAGSDDMRKPQTNARKSRHTYNLSEPFAVTPQEMHSPTIPAYQSGFMVSDVDVRMSNVNNRSVYAEKTAPMPVATVLDVQSTSMSPSASEGFAQEAPASSAGHFSPAQEKKQKRSSMLFKKLRMPRLTAKEPSIDGTTRQRASSINSSGSYSGMEWGKGQEYPQSTKKGSFSSSTSTLPVGPERASGFRLNSGANAHSPRSASSTSTYWITQPKPASSIPAFDFPQRKFVQITTDSENYKLVDVASTSTGAELRSLVCSKLPGIVPGSAIDRSVLYITQFGALEHTEPLNDEKLSALLTLADASASVKLFVSIPAATPQPSPRSHEKSLKPPSAREQNPSSPASRAATSPLQGSPSESEFAFQENTVASFEGAPAFEDVSDDENEDSLWAIKPRASFQDGQNSAGSRKNVEYTDGDDRFGLNSPLPNLASHSPKSAEPPKMAAASPSGVQVVPSRQKSFAKHSRDWILRPDTQILYDNLGDFFPNHDLDKPIVDELEGSTQSQHRSGAKISRRPVGDGTAISRSGATKGRLKSIRHIAAEAAEMRKKLLLRTSAYEKESQVSLLRRRSTKVWGSRVIEMKPGKQGLDATDEEGDPLKRKPTFKWLRGELIGKGTYGRVYLGMNINTGELLAVKQVDIPQHFLGDEGAAGRRVETLYAEIENMKDLEHINIVQYLGYEQSKSSLSIFLEYIPGGSVGRCLKNYGKFEESLIRDLTRQTLQALAYLHGRGILHRDLKADNLLLDLDGVCKISDFGISKRSDPSDPYDNDANMSMQGTIFWMAPEVVQNRKQGYSAKIDIWSLGCVVLEMFAGRRPWSNDEAIGALFKLGSERLAPPIPDDVAESLSLEARDFLDQCFTIIPTERPTAEALLQHPFCQADPSFRFSETCLASRTSRK